MDNVPKKKGLASQALKHTEKKTVINGESGTDDIIITNK
jgi:hypothetical protein